MNFAKSVLFICHGLNTSPNSLKEIEHVFSQKDIDVINITLPGHETNSKQKSLYLADEKWENHIYNVVSDVYDLYESIRFVGYSLGALLITNLLIKNREINNRTTNITFISPAFKVTTNALIFKLITSILPKKYLISSFAPKEIRANRAIPVGWYNRTFSLQKEITQQTLNDLLCNIKVDIIIDKKDELTSYKKISILVNGFNNNNWNLITVNSKNKIKHIIIDRASLSSGDWKILTRSLTKNLNNSTTNKIAC